MLKYLFVAVLFCSTAFAGQVTESVALEQKLNAVKVTIIVDGTALIAEYVKAKSDLDAQRAASLADKTQKDAEGKDVTVALTPAQKDFVNTSFDNQVAAAKRMLQLKFMDAAGKKLQTSMQRASLSDADVEVAKAAAKAKIDAEAAEKELLKPTVDVDAVK